MHTKRFNTFFKKWVQFRVGAIPCECNSTSTVSTLFLLGRLAFYTPLVLPIASSKQMYIQDSIWYGEVNKYVLKTKTLRCISIKTNKL